MLQIRKSKELRAQIRRWRQDGETIAFVPTMGNLHDGHLSLARIAREQADRLVSSIFVNPMQFGPNEDFDSYPRTVEDDCKALMEEHCDLVYLPEVNDLYPQDLAHMTRVEVPDITSRLEGQFRPGHMTGVSTIVLKLFNLVQPDMAIFGKKDYQQWRLIEKMVHDLNLPIDIIGGETRREPDGLAMSSRNQYLSAEERSRSLALYRQLTAVSEIIGNNGDVKAALRSAVEQLASVGFEVDYFELCHRQTLEPARPGDPLVLLAAARMGRTRLIDNLEV
jgi:pantoate--beta-alanine ligase